MAGRSIAEFKPTVRCKILFNLAGFVRGFSKSTGRLKQVNVVVLLGFDQLQPLAGEPVSLLLHCDWDDTHTRRGAFVSTAFAEETLRIFVQIQTREDSAVPLALYRVVRGRALQIVEVVLLSRHLKLLLTGNPGHISEYFIPRARDSPSPSSTCHKHVHKHHLVVPVPPGAGVADAWRVPPRRMFVLPLRIRAGVAAGNVNGRLDRPVTTSAQTVLPAGFRRQSRDSGRQEL